MSRDHVDNTLRRHCMVVHAYYPFGETRVERQAHALVDCGYEVDVICLRAKGQPAISVEDGIRIICLPMNRYKRRGLAKQLLEYLSFFVLAFIKLASLHHQRRYDLVQVHNLPDFLIFAALVPKLRGARLILDLHDLMPEFYAARFSSRMSSWPIRLIRWQEKLACRFADHVITVTEPWRETLIQRGVPAKKVTVVMNVADDDIFYPQPGPEPPTGDPDCLRLIYHGNLTPRYGIDLAIRAVDLARQKANVHFTIHGATPYLETLKKLTNQLDLDDHVHFSTSAVPTTELPELIKKAHVGVVPYRRDVFTDGILPTKLMEYVALGMPVIAARTPAIDAYFDETMVKFFIPGDLNDLARCILALHANREHMSDLVQGAEKFRQRYNWSKIKAEYIALVQRLGEIKHG